MDNATWQYTEAQTVIQYAESCYFTLNVFDHVVNFFYFATFLAFLTFFEILFQRFHIYELFANCRLMS